MSFSTLVLADFFNGNDLKKILDEQEGGKGSFSEGVYAGYVSGVSDALDGTVYCIPSQTTIRQSNAIVKKYLEANPEKWNEPGSMLIVEALSKAFPCKRGK